MHQVLSESLQRKREQDQDRIIRLAECERMVGLRKSSIYSLMKAGKFVPTVRLSSRCVGWSFLAVSAWVQSRITDAEAQQ